MTDKVGWTKEGSIVKTGVNVNVFALLGDMQLYGLVPRD